MTASPRCSARVNEPSPKTTPLAVTSSTAARARCSASASPRLTSSSAWSDEEGDVDRLGVRRHRHDAESERKGREQRTSYTHGPAPEPSAQEVRQRHHRRSSDREKGAHHDRPFPDPPDDPRKEVGERGRVERDSLIENVSANQREGELPIDAAVSVVENAKGKAPVHGSGEEQQADQHGREEQRGAQRGLRLQLGVHRRPSRKAPPRLRGRGLRIRQRIRVDPTGSGARTSRILGPRPGRCHAGRAVAAGVPAADEIPLEAGGRIADSPIESAGVDAR